MVFKDISLNDGDIVYFSDYIPQGVNNPRYFYDRRSEEYVLAFKHNDLRIVKQVGDALLPLLGSDFVLAAIPSSDKDKNGITAPFSLIRYLMHFSRNRFIDGSSCVYRHTSKASSHGEGNRDINEMRNTIQVCNSELFHGRDVLLIDDIVTTGTSIKAVSELLKASGARRVISFAVGKTVGNDALKYGFILNIKNKKQDIQSLIDKIEKLPKDEYSIISVDDSMLSSSSYAKLKQEMQVYEGCITFISDDENEIVKAKRMWLNTVFIGEKDEITEADFTCVNCREAVDEFDQIISSIRNIRKHLITGEYSVQAQQLYSDVLTRFDSNRFPRNTNGKSNLRAQQLQGIYIDKKVWDYIETLEESERDKVMAVYQYAAPFEFITNYNSDTADENTGKINLIDQMCMVAKNIVQRGIPTFAPNLLDAQWNKKENLFVGGIIKSLLGGKQGINTKDLNSVYSFKYTGADGESRVLVKRRVTETQHKALGYMSDKLSAYVELFKPATDILSATNTDDNKLSSYAHICLSNYRDILAREIQGDFIDMALVMPKISGDDNCIPFITEEYGSMSQQTYDLLEEVKWLSPVNGKQKLNDLFQDSDSSISVFDSILNSNEPILNNVYLPDKVAKITVAFLNIVHNKGINILNRSPKILVQNNVDDNIFLLGVQNALNMLHHLGRMIRSNYKIQPVRIVMKNNLYTLLPEGRSSKKKLDRKFNPDITIVERLDSTVALFNPINVREKVVYLYSAYSECSHYTVNVCNKPIKYNISSKNVPDLEFFLNMIFRKEHFRPKQFDIVAAALNRKNVIGLLPTGSGKTITFQLSTLLQPQVSIIISPLVALMTDQVINLRKTAITSCTTINSTVAGDEKRRILKNISDTRYQLIYVAPERLQMRKFKEKMSQLNVAHVILDEAHCVSQWGHDFRTSYLRVGESVEKYFPDTVTMALTGTASCNVVTDIKRELRMYRNVEVVTPTSFRRNELHFHVCEMDKNYDLLQRIENDIIEDVINTAPKLYAKWEQGYNVEKFYEKNDRGYENAGIIFCPYATAQRKGSVDTMHNKMQDRFAMRKIKAGKYHGSIKSVEEKMKEQQDFVDGNTAILFATKAFGMGIDKPNIRYTIHSCIPESIEQFYQEAGRAGRDRNNAVNIIIAPPVKLEFEKIQDKSISDYFFNNTFPPKAVFQRQIMEFLNMGQLWERSYKDSIFEYLNEEDMVASNMDISYNQNSQSVRFRMGKAYYNVNITHDLQVDCQRVNEIGNDIYNNKIFRIFEKNILEHLKSQFNKKGKLQQKTFNNAFRYVCYDIRNSIMETLKHGKDAVGNVCYIGVENAMLQNPIDMMIRGIHEEKGGYVLVENEYKGKLEKLRLEYQNWKKRKDGPSREFFDIYNRVRWFNKLNPVTVDEFNRKWSIAVTREKGDREITGLQEKILYYLGILGVYSDYERCYAPDAIKITMAEVNKETIRQNIRKFISGYETKDYLRKQMGVMKELDRYADDDVENLVKFGLEYVIDYAYEKIKAFRHKQVEIMYECIRHYDKNDDKKFEEEVYKYFESKYADELLNDVNNENLNLLDKWIDKVDNDSSDNAKSANIRENLSHLRTSALKVQEARPQAFTPYLLYAYAILSDPDMDIADGIMAYKRGVEQVRKSRANYRTTLTKMCRRIFNGAEDYYLREVDSILKLNFNRDEELREMRNALMGCINK